MFFARSDVYEYADISAVVQNNYTTETRRRSLLKIPPQNERGNIKSPTRRDNIAIVVQWALKSFLIIFRDNLINYFEVACSTCNVYNL